MVAGPQLWFALEFELSLSLLYVLLFYHFLAQWSWREYTGFTMSICASIHLFVCIRHCFVLEHNFGFIWNFNFKNHCCFIVRSPNQFGGGELDSPHPPTCLSLCPSVDGIVSRALLQFALELQFWISFPLWMKYCFGHWWYVFPLKWWFIVFISVLNVCGNKNEFSEMSWESIRS